MSAWGPCTGSDRSVQDCTQGGLHTGEEASRVSMCRAHPVHTEQSAGRVCVCVCFVSLGGTGQSVKNCTRGGLHVKEQGRSRGSIHAQDGGLDLEACGVQQGGVTSVSLGGSDRSMKDCAQVQGGLPRASRVSRQGLRPEPESAS